MAFEDVDCQINNDSTFSLSGNAAAKTGTEPMMLLSHQAALNYCEWLIEGKRAAGRLPAGYAYGLPTEAPWEHACRAGTTTLFSFGDDPGYTELDLYGWYGVNSGSRPHPVG